MDANASLETRVAVLERALTTSRRIASALGVGFLTLVVAALTPQAPAAATLQAGPAPQEQELFRTQGLVLTNELGVDMVMLRAGDDGSLIVQTPDGAEIVRLGGDAARRIGH